MDYKESDGLNENLSNLAIVETIDITIRRKEPVPNEISNNSYKERKNFKIFRKNKLLPKERRHFIDMELVSVGDGVDNVLVENNTKDKESTQKQLKLMSDIGGVMGDVSGYKPYSISLEDDRDRDVNSFSFGISNEPFHESTLSVPEDDSQNTPAPGNKRKDHETLNGTGDNDDDDDDDLDDDDDDDQPKFAFSRT